jgi:hypothetical protein
MNLSFNIDNRVNMPFDTHTNVTFDHDGARKKGETLRPVEPATRAEIKLINMAYNKYGKSTVPAPSGMLINFVVV